MSMQCDCSVDTTDCEGWLIFNSEIRTARKPHKCCECHDEIKPGQKYEYAGGLTGNNDFDYYRTCMPCAAIRNRYCPGGYIFGELDMQLRECLGMGLKLRGDEDE